MLSVWIRNVVKGVTNLNVTADYATLIEDQSRQSKRNKCILHLSLKSVTEYVLTSNIFGYDT